MDLDDYYIRFIEGFSKLAFPLTQLSRNSQAYMWNAQRDGSFQELKRKLTSAPILILSSPSELFVVYCDATNMSLDGVVMYNGQVVAYSSRELKVCERNYPTHYLELTIMVFVLKV